MEVHSNYDSRSFVMSLHSKITVTNLQQMELPDPVAIISVKPEDMDDCMEDSVKVVEMVEQVEVNVIVEENGTYLEDANGVRWYFSNTNELGVEQWTCQQEYSSTVNTVSQHDVQEEKFSAVNVCSECGGELHVDAKDGPPVCIKCTVGSTSTSIVSSPNVCKTDNVGQSLLKTHVCAICNEQFARFVDLKNHSLVHTEASATVKEKQTNNMSIKRPLVGISEESHTSCDVKQASRSSREFEKKKPEELPFVCAACSERFPDQEALREHFLEHEEEEPFECLLCRQHLMDKYELAVHSVVHNLQPGPFTCEVCNRRFQTLARLRMHSYVHLKVKEYPCKTCRKCFSQPQQLKKHKSAHDVKLYICNSCHREFRRSGHLKRHYCPQRKRLLTRDCNKADTNDASE